MKCKDAKDGSTKLAARAMNGARGSDLVRTQTLNCAVVSRFRFHDGVHPHSQTSRGRWDETVQTSNTRRWLLRSIRQFAEAPRSIHDMLSRRQNPVEKGGLEFRPGHVVAAPTSCRQSFARIERSVPPVRFW